MKAVWWGLGLAGLCSALVLWGESLAEHAPGLPTWLAIAVNAMVVFGLAITLARRTEQARRQTELAAFSRELADGLARQTTPTGVLEHSAGVLSRFLGVSVSIMVSKGSPAVYDAAARVDGEQPLQVRSEAIQWSAGNARPVGPGTGNWTDFPVWYVPFSRLPGPNPVLLVGVKASLNPADTLSFLRGFADQVAAVWDRLLSLQQAKQAELAAERQRLQNSFLASISHDMRTPLTALLGTASTLLAQGDQLTADQQRHLLEGMHKEVGFLVRATDNVLSVVRLGHLGPGDVVTDWESPEELLGLALARFSDATRQGRLQAQADPSTGLVRANATLVVQALVNLVDNALKWQQSFEPVVLSLRVTPAWVVFTVSDRGPGFPPDVDLDRLRQFPRYDRNRQGTGLGLSIVSAIARVHEGQLQVLERAGGGSEVSLRLPIPDSQEPPRV